MSKILTKDITEDCPDKTECNPIAKDPESLKKSTI